MVRRSPEIIHLQEPTLDAPLPLRAQLRKRYTKCVQLIIIIDMKYQLLY